jgi:hypothetical protein
MRLPFFSCLLLVHEDTTREMAEAHVFGVSSVRAGEAENEQQ